MATQTADAHQVNIMCLDGNGEVSADKTSAVAGETVTVTVTPHEGYVVNQIIAPGLDVVKKSETTYTFVMPDRDATFAVMSFRRAKSADQRELTLEGDDFDIKSVSSKAPDGGDAQSVPVAYSNADENNVYYLKPGDKVTVEIQPKKNYQRIDNVALRLSDGTEITGTTAPQQKDSKIEDDKQVSTWTFTMPEGDAGLDISVKDLKTTYSIKTNPENFASHVGKSTDNVKAGPVNALGYKYLTIDNVIDGAYYDADITLSTDENGVAIPTKISKTKHADNATTYAWNGLNAENATVSVKLNKVNDAHAINFDKSSLPAMATLTNGGNTLVRKGDTVTLTLDVNQNDEGYYYDTAAANKPVVTTKDGKQVDVTPGQDNATATKASWTFKMPDDEVTVSTPENLVSRHAVHKISIAKGSSNLVSVDGGEAEARGGSKVKLNLSQPEQGAVRYIKVSGDHTKYYVPENDGKDVTITMPEGDAEVSAVVNTRGSWTDSGNYDEDYYNKAAGNWKIYNAEQLATLAKRIQDGYDENPNGTSEFDGCTITIENNIDLSKFDWKPVRINGNNHGLTIKGNGKSITGLSVKGSGDDEVGMFVSASIKMDNLTVKGSVESIKYANSPKSTWKTTVAGISAEGSVSANKCTFDIAVDVKGDAKSGLSTQVYASTVANRADGSFSNNTVAGSVSLSDCQDASEGVLAGVFSNSSQGEEGAINNNLITTKLNAADSVNASGIRFVYLERTFNYNAPDPVNNVYAGSVTGAKQTAAVGFGSDRIDSNKNYVVDRSEPEAAIDPLNKWVDDNNAETKQYLSWKSGSDGAPILNYGSADSESVDTSTHSITLKSNEEGGYVSVDKSAKAGSKVRISASPKQLYAVDSIKVYSTDENARVSYPAPTFQKNGDYFFAMPSDDVTVEVVFKYVGENIATNIAGKGTVDIKTAKNNRSDIAEAGETVNVNASAADGYTFHSLEVKDENGNEVKLKSSEIGKYSFVMPESPVTISAVFEDASSIYHEDGTLKDGTYTVPATIMSWLNPQNTSMAKAALDGPLTVTVKDGKETYHANFKGIELSGLTGHLQRLWTYEDETAKSDPIEARIVKTTTDSLGNTFARAFEFDRNTTAREGQIIIQVKVDAMGNTLQNARLIPDWTKIQKAAADAGDVDSSKKALEDAIADAQKVKNDDKTYTDASFKALTDAIAAGQEALKKDGTTATDFDAATSAIQLAKQNLVKVGSVDKTTLEGHIKTARGYKQSDYTADSWKKLSDTLAEAEKVGADANATQEQVDSAVSDLASALLGLQKADGKSSGDASKEVLDPSNLADGEYNVNVDMMNASNPSQASMSDKAVTKPITITVKDGRYYATVNMHGIEITLLNQTFFGYLKQLSYWDGSGYQPVTVNSTYDVVDGYNKGADGKAELKYPKQMTFPLVNKDKGDQDGYVKLQVFVPIMESIQSGSGTQQALMRIDWSTLKKGAADAGSGSGDSGKTTDDAQAKKESLEALNKAISDAQGIKNDDKAYTAESFKKLTDAIAAGQKAAADSGATKADYDAAAKAIAEAKAGLKKADKELQASLDSLNKAIADAQAVKNDKGEYTADSFKAFTDAIASAQKIAADKNATKAQLDAAAKAVPDARAGLKKVDSGKADAAKQRQAALAKLNRAIGAAETVSNKGNRYTASSFKKLTDAIAAAERLASDDGATASQLDAAAKAIAKARAGLKAPTSVTAGSVTYKLSGKTVIAKPAKGAKSVTIADTVKIGGKTYKVTGIRAGAFKGEKKLRKVTVGKNVRTIGKRAFYKAKNLKAVVFKGKAAPKAGKQAFEGISKKARVTVPKKASVRKYQKLLKKAGAPKTVKVKRA